ncbi:MAG: hypothetical protein DVB27_07450 [Verrucomicrobia bacterium]|nr:MAG: hypothetical protein DVB27_07450 [Verrucomicrobiota bacterium]
MFDEPELALRVVDERERIEALKEARSNPAWEYLQGKLLGYSDEDIALYLRKHPLGDFGREALEAARSEAAKFPGVPNASARQLTLGDIPLRVGKTFGEGNPELLKSDATLKEPIPLEVPIFQAVKKVRAMIHDGPLEFFSTTAVNVAKGPTKFKFAPGPKENWQAYYEHLVRPTQEETQLASGGPQPTKSKYAGALSVRQTLQKPQFSLIDGETQNVIFARVYDDGQIHFVVTTPREGRVVTQFMFNDADGSRHMDDRVSGTRATWEKDRATASKGPSTPALSRSQRLDATGSTEPHTTEVRPQQPGDWSSSIPAGSMEVDPRQQGHGLPDHIQGRSADDSTGERDLQGPSVPGGAMPLALRQPLATLAVKEDASYEAAKALFDRGRLADGSLAEPEVWLIREQSRRFRRPHRRCAARVIKARVTTSTEPAHFLRLKVTRH